MDKRYQHLTSAKAFELANDIQEIFWEKILPIRLKLFISSVLQTDDSEKFDFMVRLQAKYPFLSKHIFVFDMPPGISTPIHLDNGPPERERINGKRLLSINIPISGCDELCPTEFFEVDPKHLVFLRDANITGVVPGAPIKLVDQYVLKDCPILVNTQTPHRVNNKDNNKNRTSVSWTIKDTWSWDEVINCLEP